MISLRPLAISLLAALAAPTAALAQTELKQEITVERTVTVDPADATKLPVRPVLELPTLPAPEPLPWSSRGVTAALQPGVATATPGAPQVYGRQWPGYVSLTAGSPVLAGSLSAGYRLVGTRRTSLDARLQAMTDNYSRSSIFTRTNTALLGLALQHAAGRDGLLTARLGYEWDRFNIHDFTLLTPRQQIWQSASRVRVAAGWQAGSRDAFSYAAAADYAWMGFSNTFPGMDKASDNEFTLTGHGRLAFADNMAAALHAAVDVVAATKAQAVVTLLPRWEWTTHTVSVDAGPRLDIDANCGTTAMHVSPAVNVSWRPLRGLLSATARAYGRQKLARLTELSRLTPRMAPWADQWPVQKMPLAVGATLTAGPWRGLSLTLTADWAKASQWLMPVNASDGTMWAAAYAAQRVIGWRVGVEARAAVGRSATISASWQTASNGPGHGWWEWADRPSNVVDIKVGVTPLRPLEVNLGWQLRTKRRLLTPADDGSWGVDPLGNASLLDAEALWHFSPRLTAYVRGTNLLNSKHVDISLTPAAGPRGWVGATFLF